MKTIDDLLNHVINIHVEPIENIPPEYENVSFEKIHKYFREIKKERKKSKGERRFIWHTSRENKEYIERVFKQYFKEQLENEEQK